MIDKLVHDVSVLEELKPAFRKLAHQICGPEYTVNGK
jgi:hypothetical protein